MRTDNPIRLIRELKGAPLSIVLVLQIVTQRVTQEYLERATGYTDKPVSQALEYLREIGMVDHTRAGWQLCRQAEQLPLGLVLDEGGAESTTETQRTAEIYEGGEEEVTPAQNIPEDPGPGGSLGAEEPVPPKSGGTHIRFADVSRNISDSVIIITDSDSLNSEGGSNNNNNGPPPPQNAGQGRNFSDSDNSSPDYFEQNLAALGAARVVGAKRQALARLDHVTPAYVRAWEAQLKHELGERYKPGLLICTIESGAEAPAVNSNGHARVCTCEECRRLRYAGDG